MTHRGAVEASIQKSVGLCVALDAATDPVAGGRGCKVGVNLHREQGEYTPTNSHGNRTLFDIWTWGGSILDQLANVRHWDGVGGRRERQSRRSRIA